MSSLKEQIRNIKSILLRHIGGSIVEVEVVDADYFKNGKRTNPYLKIRFSIAGVYYIDLIDNCLQMNRSKNTWKVENIEDGWRLWYEWNKRKIEYLRMIPVKYHKVL